MMASDARASLRQKLDGSEFVELQVLAMDRFSVYELDPVQAERLLYDLHTISQTLRGVYKPLRWRDRLRNLSKSLSGR